VKVREIKRALKAAAIGCGVNLYADEPTSSFHYVAAEKGRGNDAIAALKAAGGDAVWVPACSHIYADNLQVRR
jgi:hypothetical protein